MQFTYVDIAFAVIVLLSAFLAFSRGVTREVLAIGGWILAGLIAFPVAPLLEPLLREVPGVGAFFRDSCNISMIVAFALVVAAALLVLAVFTPIFASVVRDGILGPIDRALGFLFGVARGVLLVAVAFLVFDNLSGAETIPALDNAASRPIFGDVAGMLDAMRPTEMPTWFTDRIDALMSPCGGAGLSSAMLES